MLTVRGCCLFLGVACAVLSSSAAAAAQVATLSDSGDPALLRVSSAAAGSSPAQVINSTTTYDVSITALSGTRWKITAALSSALPPGVTLSVNLAAPTGATSHGAVALSTTAQTVVSDIAPGTHLAMGITYTLSSTAAAGTVSQASRTVTVTVEQVS